MAVVIQASAVTTEKSRTPPDPRRRCTIEISRVVRSNGKIGELRYADSQIGQSQIDGKKSDAGDDAGAGYDAALSLNGISFVFRAV